jgi:hypothetical protein
MALILMMLLPALAPIMGLNGRRFVRFVRLVE